MVDDLEKEEFIRRHQHQSEDHFIIRMVRSVCFSRLHDLKPIRRHQVSESTIFIRGTKNMTMVSEEQSDVACMMKNEERRQIQGLDVDCGFGDKMKNLNKCNSH
jgi:hypothetical protein